MAVFAIGDLHLSGVVNKPMDVFGSEWDQHADQIQQSWLNTVKEEDIVLIPGDISWAMTLEEAKPDLDWISKLPGTKLLIRGNHDYWWKGISKVRSVMPHKLYAIQNDAIQISKYIVCGTRGWLLPTHPQFKEHDELVLHRELERLKMSLESAVKLGQKIIVMLHYPPTTQHFEDTPFTKILDRYPVSTCIYGHLHGPSHRFACLGEKNGIRYQLVSSDYLKFNLIGLEENLT